MIQYDSAPKHPLLGLWVKFVLRDVSSDKKLDCAWMMDRSAKDEDLDAKAVMDNTVKNKQVAVGQVSDRNMKTKLTTTVGLSFFVKYRRAKLSMLKPDGSDFFTAHLRVDPGHIPLELKFMTVGALMDDLPAVSYGQMFGVFMKRH